MLYCPPNITLGEVWLSPGTSDCFVETVSTSVFLGIILILGSVRLRLYKKYGTAVDADLLQSSKTFTVQLFFTLLLPLLAVVRFVLQWTVINGGAVYGYMVSFSSYINSFNIKNTTSLPNTTI